MRRAEAPAPVDPLGAALHFLRMSGVFYCRAEFSAPWALVLPAVQDCQFHVVTSGRCWLETGDGEHRLLQQGDLALVRRGEGHRLSSDADVPGARIDQLDYEQVSDRYAVVRHGGGGAATSLICGVVSFDHPAAYELLRLLPTVIHVEVSSSPQTAWIQDTLRFIAAEAKSSKIGGETVITRLADILVIQAIRSWIEEDPAAKRGWLGALHDRQIGRAIFLIQGDPARGWTLASLAREVSMSRSAFSARFTELVGEPAMRYVTRWRMQVAITWLKDDRTGLSELAGRLGYQSEAAFSRAFKRIMGVPPGSIRAAAQPLNPDPSQGIPVEVGLSMDDALGPARMDLF